MGHFLRLKCAHSPSTLRILSSTTAPFTIMTVQVPNLALTHTKRITVWSSCMCNCLAAASVASAMSFLLLVILWQWHRYNLCSFGNDWLQLALLWQWHGYNTCFCSGSGLAAAGAAVATFLPQWRCWGKYKAIAGAALTNMATADASLLATVAPLSLALQKLLLLLWQPSTMLLWQWQGCSRCYCGNVLAAAGAVFNIWLYSLAVGGDQVSCIIPYILP
jgi:hypothetical protein